jgi:hypothetical protein
VTLYSDRCRAQRTKSFCFSHRSRPIHMLSYTNGLPRSYMPVISQHESRWMTDGMPSIGTIVPYGSSECTALSKKCFEMSETDSELAGYVPSCGGHGRKITLNALQTTEIQWCDFLKKGYRFTPSHEIGGCRLSSICLFKGLQDHPPLLPS